MERTRLAKASIEEHKKGVRVAKARKEKLQSYISELNEAYSKGKISQAEYLEISHKKHNGRNIQELIHHYDHFINHSERHIKKHTHKRFSFNFFVFILMLSILSLTIFYFKPGLTGFFAQPNVQNQEFSQTLNLNFNESINYEWKPENSGQIGYLKLSGFIRGKGPVKIYLDNLLILDSTKIKETDYITGASISNSEGINETPQNANESSPFQGESPSSENTTNVSQDQTEQGNESQVNITEKEIIKTFSNICEETCDLSGLNLSEASYNLRIEINNAELFLDAIRYSLIKEIIEEKPKINITPETNVSLEANATIQGEAVLGQPVKWIKKFNIKEQNSKIKIPKEAEKIETLNSQGEKTKFNVDSLSQEKEVTIQDNPGDYEVSYETPAPLATEEQIPRGKKVKISSPDNVHYTDVLAFTNLNENLNIKDSSKVKIYWEEQKIYITPQTVQDKDGNGVYDYIEWVVPSLSNQTFDIIVITKAEHLDKNKIFISDIYEQVKTLDNVWSEEIPNQDYVRVTFEVPLDNTRDITIFPRVVTGNPKIEVYEVNQNTLIAEFTNLIDNEYNKILLTNLVGEQDTFDLKILGGSVEFDYIVDPIAMISNYNFSDSTNNKAYWASPSGPQSPPWSALGTEASAAQYTNLSTDNTQYARVAGDATSDDPYWRFNFTINEDTSNILWINVSFNGYENASEAGRVLIWNYSSAAYISIATMPTSDGVVSWNFTGSGNASTLINSVNNQLVLYVDGTSFDNAGDRIWADFPRVLVGYLSDSENPKYQNPSTDDTNPLPTTTVSHNINWTDDFALSFSMLEVNSSGASCNTASNVSNTTLSGMQQWSNLSWQVPNACEGKTVGWKQYANDTSNKWNVTTLQTYNVQNVAPIASFGTNPIDVYNSTSSSVTFDLKVSDNLAVSYLKLYGNWSGTWQANQTNSSPYNDTYWNKTVSGIPDGYYVWAAWGNDSVGNSAFTTANRTLTIDTIPPTITLPVYTNGTQKSNTQTLTLNISVTDATTSPSYCNIEINGTNTTLAVSNGWCNTTNGNLTGLSDGNKTIKVYVNDTVGNLALNNSYVVDIITLNSAPTIGSVEAISAQDPTIGTTKSITFNFTATDTNGGTDINVSSAAAYFQRAGETTRSNLSCINSSGPVGNNINITCTINMWYYDQNGAWTINVTVKDNSDLNAENSSTTFTYNLLTAMVMSPTSLSWSEINPLNTNTGSNNDPIVINNSGNDVNLNINVTGYDLQGETTTTQYIYAANFTVENTSEGCSGTTMSNATSINVTTAILQRGNTTLNYNNDTSGQEQIYFCLKGVPSGISSQSYSSSAYGAWAVAIIT